MQAVKCNTMYFIVTRLEIKIYVYTLSIYYVPLRIDTQGNNLSKQKQPGIASILT